MTVPRTSLTQPSRLTGAERKKLKYWWSAQPRGIGSLKPEADQSGPQKAPRPPRHRHGTGHLLTVAFLLRSWLSFIHLSVLAALGLRLQAGFLQLWPAGSAQQLWGELRCSGLSDRRAWAPWLWQLGCRGSQARGISADQGPSPGPCVGRQTLSTGPLAKSRNTFDLKDFINQALLTPQKKKKISYKICPTTRNILKMLFFFFSFCIQIRLPRVSLTLSYNKELHHPLWSSTPLPQGKGWGRKTDFWIT